MKANPHFCSPKLYFSTLYADVKEHFYRLLRKKDLVRVFRLWPNVKMVCFCFCIALSGSCQASGQTPRRSLPPSQGLGLTGLEPVTLRLSSACSNQLSYRPGVRSRQVQVRPFC